MINYIQLTPSNIVHTIMSTPKTLPDVESIKQVDSFKPEYVGSKWDGQVYRKLKITPTKTTLILNEITNIFIDWVDIDGNAIMYGEDVELSCNGMTEDVKIINGVGSTIFESAESGEFTIVASSGGVTTNYKVVVS